MPSSLPSSAASASSSSSSSSSAIAATAATVAPLPTAAWAARAPLLFFAGHVPKLYLGQTQRYELWRQLRREPGVRAISSTINCTVGADAICQTPERWPAEWATYCQEPCGSRRQCSTSDSGLRRQVEASCQTEGHFKESSPSPHLFSVLILSDFVIGEGTLANLRSHTLPHPLFHYQKRRNNKKEK